MKRTSDDRGFTLIELMMVVAILGIIAAIAIPTFTFFVSRSKTSEASTNLNNLFKSAAAYYNKELSDQAMGATTTGHCTVASAGPVPATPTSAKVKGNFSADPNFRAMGFGVSDYIYYSYSADSAGALCGWGPGTQEIYTFRAEGNLDGDGALSTFELATGSDVSNTLYHARGIHIIAESE